MEGRRVETWREANNGARMSEDQQGQEEEEEEEEEEEGKLIPGEEEQIEGGQLKNQKKTLINKWD